MKSSTRLGALTLVAGLTLTACGAPAAVGAVAGRPAGTSDTATSVAKVSANQGTLAEITAALTAVGVDNAARWAGEVAEYRPYDTSDANLTHLRDELAKYNPGPGVIDLIVSALTP